MAPPLPAHSCVLALPPSRCSDSNMWTSWPAAARDQAAPQPAMPPPITATRIGAIGRGGPSTSPTTRLQAGRAVDDATRARRPRVGRGSLRAFAASHMSFRKRKRL